MNGILIIAHAPLGHAFRQSALHVFPDCGLELSAVDVQPHVSLDESLNASRIALEQLMAQPAIEGVLVLTDVFGASPCNVAQKLVDGVRTRLVAGLNLPLLLRALTYRKENLDALVTRAVAGGTQGVMQVAITAPQNQARRVHDPKHHDHQQ